MSYGYKNFIRIAKEYINPSAEGKERLFVEDVERRLKGWFCIQYNTTLNDPRLLDMTLEELFIQYFIDKIHKNPGIIEEELSDRNEYEEWLKRVMGEAYVTEEQMVADIEAEGKEFSKKIADKYPEKITTSFDELKEFTKGK